MLLALLLSIVVDAHRATELGAAMAEAKKINAPIIAFLHGSDWHRRGEALHERMWTTDATDNLFRDRDIVLLDVDIPQSPSEENAAAQKGLHRKWQGRGLRTYPAIIALTPDGKVLGARQGDTLPYDPTLARQQLLELAKASLRSLQLRATAAAAKERGDVATEVNAIHKLIDLPLARPKTQLARLAEIDPEDPSGIRRRLSMPVPAWHNFVAKATKDAKEGRSEETIARLGAMLAEDVYTAEQQAWIHVAIGSAHRQTEGHALQAANAFATAHTLSPDSLAGNAGRRLNLVLYADPSIEIGWAERHCATERAAWTLADAPDSIGPGSYTMMFTLGQRSHPLHVDLVEFIDPTSGEAIAIDSHVGIISTKPEQPSFELHLDETIANPIIRIHGNTVGGTKSRGTIILTGPGLDG